jgi:hypothetical protein
MLGVIEVNLVGTDVDWLDILLAIIGPILISGAAVFAAVTARKSAIERQEEQLEHDTQRQKEALAHDLKRQEMALDHDREMRNRESSRTVIDDAMEVANSAIEKFSTLEVRVKNLQATMDADGKGDDDLLQRAEEKHRECSNTVIELMANGLRLRTRPDVNELADAYRELRECFTEHEEALKKGISSKLSTEQMSEIKDIDSKGTEKFARLLSKWRAWLEA